MCCCVETIYRRVMLYTSKDREKNIFSDDITFNTVSKTSDLLLRKSTNLNNNPRMLGGNLGSLWYGDVSVMYIYQFLSNLYGILKTV